jgi:hypothetical protein
MTARDVKSTAHFAEATYPVVRDTVQAAGDSQWPHLLRYGWSPGAL